MVPGAVQVQSEAAMFDGNQAKIDACQPSHPLFQL